MTNSHLIKASLRRLAVGYERSSLLLSFPPFPALSKEEFLRPSFPYQVRSSSVERVCGMAATSYIEISYWVTYIVSLALDMSARWTRHDALSLFFQRVVHNVLTAG